MLNAKRGEVWQVDLTVAFRDLADEMVITSAVSSGEWPPSPAHSA